MIIKNIITITTIPSNFTFILFSIMFEMFAENIPAINDINIANNVIIKLENALWSSLFFIVN